MFVHIAPPKPSPTLMKRSAMAAARHAEFNDSDEEDPFGMPALNRQDTDDPPIPKKKRAGGKLFLEASSNYNITTKEESIGKTSAVASG